MDYHHGIILCFILIFAELCCCQQQCQTAPPVQQQCQSAPPVQQQCQSAPPVQQQCQPTATEGECPTVVEAAFTKEESNCPHEKSLRYDEMVYKEIHKQNKTPLSHAPWGVKDRAYLTIPYGLRLDTSSIPDAGLGMFSNIAIPSQTWLAEYTGDLVPAHMHQFVNDDYSWMLTKNGEMTHFVDAYPLESSNYVRWVNCARNPEELNVEVAVCKGRVYYKTKRAVAPGEELLVFYGHGYAARLGINVTQFIPN